MPNVQLKLPKFKGANIEDHFQQIASEQCDPYRKLIDELLNCNDCSSILPDIKWTTNPGWTSYNKQTKEAKSIPYPEENGLVFDVEVCMSEGKGPTIACAIGKNYWYSWVSEKLFKQSSQLSPLQIDEYREYNLNELIPLETTAKDTNIKKVPKIIIGHNVSYDRARIKEQYFIEPTELRFLDTMSLHVCVSGITSYQRAILKSTSKEISEDDQLWSDQSSLNSLVDVYNLYCGQDPNNIALEKSKRNVFVNGTLLDVRENFQELMTYCANDVLATYKIVKILYPMFTERFPHPVTLAGMLEIGMAYLPINSNWKRYINEANLTYEDLDIEAKHILKQRANQACRLMHNDEYKRNLWLWDEDWSQQIFKFNKIPVKEQKAMLAAAAVSKSMENDSKDKDRNEYLRNKFFHLYNLKKYLPARRPLLPGYPNWYRKLCEKPISSDWLPGPQNVGTGMQVYL